MNRWEKYAFVDQCQCRVCKLIRKEGKEAY